MVICGKRVPDEKQKRRSSEMYKSAISYSFSWVYNAMIKITFIGFVISVLNKFNQGCGARPASKGWVFESQPRQTKVVKTGTDISTAKHSAIGVSVTGARR